MKKRISLELRNRTPAEVSYLAIIYLTFEVITMRADNPEKSRISQEPPLCTLTTEDASPIRFKFFLGGGGNSDYSSDHNICWLLYKNELKVSTKQFKSLCDSNSILQICNTVFAIILLVLCPARDPLDVQGGGADIIMKNTFRSDLCHCCENNLNCEKPITS